MNAVEVLRHESQMAYDDFLELLAGVTEKQAWAVLPNNGPDYLHTDATIHGVTLHVASGKIMYGSIAFRNTEIRWRQLADEIAEFEPDWEKAVAFFRKAHGYWLSTWSDFTDADLDREVLHFSGSIWPAWKVIRMINYHEAYHGGQIAMLRYGVAESETKPPSMAEDIREYCAELPSW